MRVLILANNDSGLYQFRKELIQELLNPGSFLEGRKAEPCEVFISLPNGEFVPDLVAMGCHFIDTPFERRGMNVFRELKLKRTYKQMIKKVKPDIVFTYTIKPNVYGAMACRALKIPCVVNITGLGTALENGGLSQKILVFLYKMALKKAQTVFFQNQANKQFFEKKKIAFGKHKMLPGSGVNLDRYTPSEYPNGETIEFAFIGRIMKEKGIDNYLEAAHEIQKKYSNVVFHICGFCEKEYKGKLEEYLQNGSIIYHGMLKDVKPIVERVSAVVLPSYHEGISNVLLEASAMGRPVLASQVHGCIETFDEGISGFGFPPNNTLELCRVVEKFIGLAYTEKQAMGLEARRKVEREFDRRMVVSAYMNELEKII